MSDDTERETLRARRDVPPEATEVYGEHPSQVIDFYGVGATGPSVAVLHGGFWRESRDRGYLTPLAAELAARGMAVSLVEYRRVGGGGGWPATADDVAAALAHLDGSPDVLLGHSAGGQLALWAAAKLERPAGRVVAVSPVADLVTAHQLRLGEDAVTAFLGGRQQAAELLPEADPMRLLPRVPVEILHGTADRVTPPDLSRRYTNDWGTRLHLLPGIGHFAPVTPNTPAFEVLAGTLR